MFGRFGGCGYGLGYGGMFGFWQLLIVIGVIVLIVVFLQMKKNRDSRVSDPLSELKNLYVKGEITEEEYFRRKEVVSKK